MADVSFVAERDPNHKTNWRVVRVEGELRFPLVHSKFRKESAALRHAAEITRDYWKRQNRMRSPYLGD